MRRFQVGSHEWMEWQAGEMYKPSRKMRRKIKYKIRRAFYEELVRKGVDVSNCIPIDTPDSESDTSSR